MLSEIVTRLEMAESDTSAIESSIVRRWMSSNDPEVLGATYSLLMDPRLVGRITPVISFDDVFTFLLRYYEFCLRNDPHGEWVDNRFTAGSDFVRVFVSYWDEGRDKKYFHEMKSLLRHLYLKGSPQIQTAIEQAIVEHLFEKGDIREFFSDWRRDPRLQSLYNAGVLWAEGGGRSPLTQR